MRRKFGILFLIGITVLAGTQEATRQFDGLKSSLKNFTRASLWSGLIVYAQPVNDGKLPTPQIYYLMPTPQQQQPVAPAAQQPVLADNGATANKPEARNNHGQEAAASNAEALGLAEMRAVEDAAESELILNKLPLNLIASHFTVPKVAPKPERARVHEEDRVRVYEEVAKHEVFRARKSRQESDEAVRVLVKEFDAAKLIAETERLLAEHEQLERLKAKTPGEAETMHRRMEMRVLRRTERTERPDRFKVVVPAGRPRGIALPEMSSIGCEKTRIRPEVAPPVPAAPVAHRGMQQMPSEPVIEWSVPDAPGAKGNTWTLNCDTEPEQK